jgi:hypothetical protein
MPVGLGESETGKDRRGWREGEKFKMRNSVHFSKLSPYTCRAHQLLFIQKT